MKKNIYFIDLMNLFVIVFCVFMLINFNQTKSDIQVPNFDIFNLIKAFFIIGIRNTLAAISLVLAHYLNKKVIIYYLLIVNSFVLSLLISKMDNIVELVLIVPHGILEITSYLLIASLALYGIKNSKSVRSLKKKYFKYYLLLILSVAIESFATPVLSAIALT